MANVVHRTTKQLLKSVNDPDFPTGTWIHNPDLSTFPGGIDGYLARYANISVDLVTYMNAGERAVVDAATAAALTTSNRANAISTTIDNTGFGFELRELIELFNKRDNYLTNRIVELQGALDAIKASSGPTQSIRDAIPASWLATNTRTRAEAITDYTDDINAGGVDV